MSLRDWTIVRILAGIATKIWAASFAALLACFILYCFYGGFIAFSLLIAAVAGKTLTSQTISKMCWLQLIISPSISFNRNTLPNARQFIVPSGTTAAFQSIHSSAIDCW